MVDPRVAHHSAKLNCIDPQEYLTDVLVSAALRTSNRATGARLHEVTNERQATSGRMPMGAHHAAIDGMYPRFRKTDGEPVKRRCRSRSRLRCPVGPDISQITPPKTPVS
jgi:hypothetical protein